MNFDDFDIKKYTPNLDSNDEEYIADMLEDLLDALGFKEVSAKTVFVVTAVLYYTFIGGYGKAKIEMEHKQ